ncbi:MAG: o-succinylbenzoate synthase [Bacteroidia bacterium]|nr:o-succinylbenzoate synthase [Bacteroidia bacterium]MCF8425773.1 o-succinylbenzoate synthase [Bacteroidia bacterium]MCF8447176.1 o-succinylbenzoate synthase [Bacteroidia bacterium]
MNDIIYEVINRPLKFSFDAKTSRGNIQVHSSYLIKAFHPKNPKIIGWGEAAPLIGLSIEGNTDFEGKLNFFIHELNKGTNLAESDFANLPSLRFAIEIAHLDLKNGGKQILFDNPFTKGNPIKINGLVWMSDLEKMLEEAIQKARTGFDTIKFKVGALDHEGECRMLEAFRKQFPIGKVEIRLDANGSFAPDDALLKMKDFRKFGIHSIEQPIWPKQLDNLEEICAQKIIPVALDEELIGIDPYTIGSNLLRKLKPQFLILKPTLLGGLAICDAWVKLADNQTIGWWATSALESNIGLNAIAQWTSIQNNKLPQGLGTGTLYQNNIASPLVVENGFLQYIASKDWMLEDKYLKS